MKKKPLGVRAELILFSVAILVLSLVMQVVFNLFFAKTMAVNQKKDQIEALYTELVAAYDDDSQRIYDIVSHAQEDQNLRIQITGPEGLVFTSDPFFERREGENPMEGTPPLRKPEAQEHMAEVRLEQTFAYEDSYRTVYIWSSVVAIDTSVALFTQSSVMVSCLVLVLAILWVVLFTRRITKPILKIEQVAQHVADLHFDQQADEGATPTELGRLAVSINTMSHNLEQMIGQLNADNQSLTVQVAQAQQLEQMRRQFIANISHEMKTPLSMLMMYSESLRSDIPGIDKTYYYDTIIEEATGLNAMVGQLLDISSIENGLLQLDCHVLDFSAFVDSVLDKQAPLFKGHRLQRKIASDVLCLGDEKYLEQALNNYLSNALSHTTESGTIWVTLYQEGTGAVLTVENQGNPIAPEDMPHLWESFYRADQARSQSGSKRVGLGLYIAKTCIQAHGGTVAVENGEGTVVFSFTLPVAE